MPNNWSNNCVVFIGFQKVQTHFGQNLGPYNLNTYFKIHIVWFSVSVSPCHCHPVVLIVSPLTSSLVQTEKTFLKLFPDNRRFNWFTQRRLKVRIWSICGRNWKLGAWFNLYLMSQDFLTNVCIIKSCIKPNIFLVVAQTSRKWLTVAIFQKWHDSSVALWIEIAVILNWRQRLEIWSGLVWFCWYSLVWRSDDQ